MPKSNLTPKPFDVVFTGGKGDLNSLFSILFQRFGDTKARYADQGFSHVSIVIDESYALEAVPAEDTTEKGPFSGSELASGVRIIPLLDLLLPTKNKIIPTAVFRSQNAATISQEEFGLRSKAILELFASEYSLNGLREAVETKLSLIPASIMDLARKKFNWTSPRENIGALLIDEEVRASLETAIPGYKFPFTDSKYFCSKLVAELLEKTGLYHFDCSPEKISPTGLYAYLAKSAQWSDVTNSDYGVDNIQKAAAASSSLSCRFAFSLVIEEIALKLRQMGIASVLDLLASGTKKFSSDLKTLDELVRNLGLSDSQRQFARNRENEFVSAITEHVAIEDEHERERFRKTVQDYTRMFGWGLLDYDSFTKALAKAVPKNT